MWVTVWFSLDTKSLNWENFAKNEDWDIQCVNVRKNWSGKIRFVQDYSLQHEPPIAHHYPHYKCKRKEWKVLLLGKNHKCLGGFIGFPSTYTFWVGSWSPLPCKILCHVGQYDAFLQYFPLYSVYSSWRCFLLILKSDFEHLLIL